MKAKDSSIFSTVEANSFDLELIDKLNELISASLLATSASKLA